MRAAFLLAAVSVVLLFANLGGYPLMAPDEARYAEAAREMVERGSYLLPTVNYEPRLQKPPLHYWLVCMSFRFFGVGEFQARLPSAVVAILTIALVGGLGARLFGTRAGLLAAGVLGLSPLFWGLARTCNTDATMTFFLTLALALFFPDPAGRRSRPAKFAAFAALALAFLTKGPVPVLVALLLLLLHGIFFREARPLLRERLLWAPGWVLFLALAAPWFVFIALGHPEAAGSWGAETVEKLGREASHQGPLHYFVPVAALGFFPWILLLPLAFARRDPGAPGGPLRFMALWAAVVFVFFSLVPSKLATYLLPAAPPAALLIGAGLDRFSTNPFPLGLFARGMFLAGLVFSGLLAAASVSLFWDRRGAAAMLGHDLPGIGIAAPAVFLLFGGAIYLADRALWAGRGIRAGFMLGMIPAAAFTLAAFVLLPADAKVQDPVLVLHAAKGRVGPGDAVAAHGFNPYLLDFYLARRIETPKTFDDCEEFLSGPGGRLLIVGPDAARQRFRRFFRLKSGGGAFDAVHTKHGDFWLYYRPARPGPPPGDSPENSRRGNAGS